MVDNFSIYELFRLGGEGPDAFEKNSRDLIENKTNSDRLELRRKLAGIQWKIDMERRRFKGRQLDFARYILEKTWTSFLELNSKTKELSLLINNEKDKNKI